MELTSEIETLAIDAKKYVTFLWPFLFRLSALALLVAVKSHSALHLCADRLFLGTPLLLGKTLRSFYTKKAVLK
jgi:hypothetical protein